ncbi:MAG: hypothetical protein QXP42_02315 [Candidatus Micrarchaeia archaeon]
MPLDELLISTGVDSLIKLIRSKGKVELSEAAEELGTSPMALEDWARVLEEEGLIRIEYQLTKIYLVWIGKTEEEMGKIIEELRDKREVLTRDLESILERMSSKGKELDEIQREFEKIARLFDPKMESIRRRVDALKMLEKEREEMYAKRLSVLDKMKNELNTVGDMIALDEKRLSEIYDRLKQLDAQAEAVKPEIAKLEEIKGDVEKIEAKLVEKEIEIEGKMKEYKAWEEEIRKTIADSKAAEQSIERINKMRVEVENSLQELIERSKKIMESIKEQQKVYSDMGVIREKIGVLEEDMKKLEKMASEINDENKLALERVKTLVKVIDEQEIEYKSLMELKESGFLIPLQRYEADLANLKSRYSEELAEASNIEKAIKDDIEASKKGIEDELRIVGETMARFEDIVKKRDEIERMIQEMQEERKRITRQVALLSKEVELLEIIGKGEEGKRKGEEITQRIEQIKEDEIELERKREKLKEFIKNWVETGEEKSSS